MKKKTDDFTRGYSTAQQAMFNTFLEYVERQTDQLIDERAAWRRRGDANKSETWTARIEEWQYMAKYLRKSRDFLSTLPHGKRTIAL